MKTFTVTDLKILGAIQEHGDLTTQQIADRINISQSPCWRRINKLEEEGVIMRKVAILDREKLGMDIVTFATIKLWTQGRDNFEEFEREVRCLPEVLECYTMAGT